ncbi:Rv3212 family protein [Gordonia caeni]|uniref:PQQ-binding-like beta-propeller repeat protein n=1 Tax=Gordonia caeni TaxID=1007097 RepID=A0ABP7NT35_9ACTN
MAARIAPERRTRLDLVITALLVVAALAAALILWWTAPARSTESVTAEQEPATPLPTESLPTELHELWRAPSGATQVPSVGKATVVTGDGGTMTGRDPATGDELWHYTRDAELCAAVAAWPGGENDALGVYRNSRGCSEVTALDAGTGARKGNRSSDADAEITLSYDKTFALAAGDTRLETWGSNLVRGIEYGRVDAPVNPDVAPERDRCRLFSAASGGDRVAVIERCAPDTGYRLTVLSSTLTSEEKVREWGSHQITDTSHGAPPVVVAVTDDTVSVYDGGADSGADAGPTVRLFGVDAVQQSARTVEGEATPPTGSLPLTARALVTYWTGRSTVVLDGGTGQPRIQISDTIGPGEVATGLLVPVAGAVSVRDPVSGRELRRIPVDRGDYTGIVSLRVLGPYVIEQRGDEVVALGPRPE